jgi:leucyl aminopeptidase (aminopeptidase T)
MTRDTLLRCVIAATAIVASTTAGAQPRNSQTVARNLVQAGMVKTGDKVLVSGSVRDAPLLEDIAVEVMKVGAHPLITIWSDRLTRRSYEDVPATYDNVTSPIGKLFVENFDVQIALDVGEAEGLLAGVPVTRTAARAKANEPNNQAYYGRNVRFVNLGNGLYPTATVSRRLGVPQSTMASAFWKAASVSPASLRTTAESLRRTIANGKVVTITAPNGTNLSFALSADRAMISDGALTEDKVKRGSAAAATWLPAGELLIPAVDGSANGKIVLDKVLWDGQVVRGLTLTFKDGVIQTMTAANDMRRLKAQYDAATGAKDRFQGIDIGVNPEMKLPVGSGRIVWGAPGSVVVGFGDNRGFGGANVSDFGAAGQLGNATVKVDGTPIISNGRLQR